MTYTLFPDISLIRRSDKAIAFIEQHWGGTLQHFSHSIPNRETSGNDDIQKCYLSIATNYSKEIR